MGREEAPLEVSTLSPLRSMEPLSPPAKLLDEENRDPSQLLREDEALKDEVSDSEKEVSVHKDCNEIKEDEEPSHIIQGIDEECPIPSPALKGIAEPDFPSVVLLLGSKYNNLIRKHHETTFELETIRTQCESLRKRCIEDCEPKYETLKKKYVDERAERKRLYNEIIELKGNIRVFCRCRPLSSEEIFKGFSSVVDFDPAQENELQIVSSDSSRKQFKFDHIFGPKDDQEAVFAETLPIVKSVLDGYNVCIFAYGQTGTGKTFTMEGTPENRGVNYRALEELFSGVEERSCLIRYEIFVSMLEVYTEKIRDLLADNTDQLVKRLGIKQAADGTQDVPGLLEAQVVCVAEVWEMLKIGGKNRSVGSTSSNELSSRSHCLVRVTIKSDNLVDGQKNKSHLWLVDLAGSERIGKTEVEGERLKESQFINKSLSALGDCISALASKNPHIPYRNSKLTHLLQSSLGGDCKTLMFAQISPSSADLGETLCTLNFASRVRGIEHGPVRKQSDPVESFKLKQMTEKLRQDEKEIARLNDSLQLMHLKYASRENVFRTLQEKIRDAEQVCKNYQQKVRDLESQVADKKKLTNNSSKFAKPPLAPMKQRPPLNGITNRLPPSATRRNSSSSGISIQNKENVLGSRNEATKPQNKARRITLAPLIRHTPVHTKRRASIAVLPEVNERRPSFPETERTNHSIGMTKLSQLRIPRRSSLATFNSVPGTPLASSTPNCKGKYSAQTSTSKFSSPSQLQALWKPKIPMISSPRQRLRLVSSPASSRNLRNTELSANKLCFSVQKRVIVSSPAQIKPAMPSGMLMFNRALRDTELVGRFGCAQRVVCKNRRKSVM